MEDVKKEWIECSLKNFEHSKKIAKVLSIDFEDAVAKGYSYGSDIRRMKLKVVLHSGLVEERHLILKSLPRTTKRRESLIKYGFFLIESKIYQEVIPAMERIVYEVDKTDNMFWPKCFGIRDKLDTFLFEDLSVLGYKTEDRLKGLDLNHAILAVKSLAKFHALGAIIIERDRIDLNDFKKFFMMKMEFECLQMHGFCLNDLADTIERKWDSIWLPYVEKLRNLSKIVTESLMSSFELDDRNFNTINHGDYSLSNMLFRYGEDGRPTSVKMIDFQICHYNNPMSDLQYLFNTSLNYETMKKRPLLLETYYSLLLKYLRAYGYSGEEPTFESIKESYDKVNIFGVLEALVIRPFMMLPLDDVPDVEVMSPEYLEEQGLTFSFYSNEDQYFIKLLEASLKHASEIGILK